MSRRALLLTVIIYDMKLMAAQKLGLYFQRTTNLLENVYLQFLFDEVRVK